MFEKVFKLSENHTNVKTELTAGITTFMTMVYILAVNPSILSASGMDAGSVLTATAVASAIACFAMAAFSNKPFALSAGLGLNAYFAYTVCGAMGYSWQVALTAVLVEGIIFILMSLADVREKIFDAIPFSLKTAVSVGIGLFICFIGLQNAGIIVDSSTLVSLFSFKTSIETGTFTTAGITVILAMIGVVITALLLIKGKKGYMLYGILITWVLGILCELTGLYRPDGVSYFSVIPTAIFSAPASMSSTFMKFDFGFIGSHFLDFLAVVIAFLFVDVFDTIGTVIGCASKADMLDKDGKLPEIKGVLLADAVGTVAGACCGTSTITTFVESSSGITEGIPSFATAPALIVVGFLMVQQVTKINWSDLTDAIPCFICMTMMAFSYSISDGIAFGIISCAVIHLLTGKGKDLSPLMYVLAVLFVLKYLLI